MFYFASMILVVGFIVRPISHNYFYDYNKEEEYDDFEEGEVAGEGGREGNNGGGGRSQLV